MEARISLNEYADIPFLKKLLESLKGVSDFEIVKNSDEEFSDEEYDKKFDELLEKSLKQSQEGKVTPYSREILRNLIRK